MTIDLTKLTDAQLETLMNNAQASTKPEVPALYRAAAVELFRRRGSDYTDPVVAGCHGAIALLERTRTRRPASAASRPTAGARCSGTARSHS